MSNKFSDDKKYILDKFYDCFTREIDTLWQRSLFLTAFITGVFVAYGKVFENVVKIKCLTIQDFKNYSFILFFISVVGMIFSLLWIYMSKASKANQEIYEAKISIMSKKLEIDASKCTENINYESFLKETGVSPRIIGIVDREKMTSYDDHWDHSIKNKFFSLNAGAYSVSRINIFLGYVLLSVWYILASFHFNNFKMTKLFCMFEFNNFINASFNICNSTCFFFFVFLLMFFLIILLICKVFNKWFYSGYLEGKNNV